MPNYDTRNVALGVCRILYDGVDLGLTKGGVEVEVTSETYKVEVDQYGKTPINEIIMGRTLSVKVPLAETTLENLVAIMPGATLVQTGGTKATGTITVTTQPAANNTVTVNGVEFTFKSSGATGSRDVLIGGTTAATASNLQAKLQAYVDPKVSVALYTVATNVVTVTYDSFGVIGNAFTLAQTGSGLTLSGATLSGGADTTKSMVRVNTGVGLDLLPIAKKMVLHPTNKPDSDKSMDFIIPRAATSGGLQFAYKLDQERVFNCTFMGYPDPSTDTLFIVGDDTTA